MNRRRRGGRSSSEAAAGATTDASPDAQWSTERLGNVGGVVIRSVSSAVGGNALVHRRMSARTGGGWRTLAVATKKGKLAQIVRK